MPELFLQYHFFTDLEIDGILYMPVYEGAKNNFVTMRHSLIRSLMPQDPVGVRIYSGSFSVYTDGNTNTGVVIL